MRIVGRALRTFQVEPGGDAFRLNFENSDGAAASLTLPADCLRSLIMTLPRVAAQALRAKYHDDTLRLVYPVGGWTLELATDGRHLILTLRTPDSFEVSFALSDRDAASLASSLAGRRASGDLAPERVN
ncbi:MAG: hypothetical protein KIT36_20735 [Alphaproteobacteria bacterium]|nr:hypothetical protein [Alphaproteobacteria bacterium]